MTDINTMFKGRTRTKPQPALKKIENAFFFTLVANMYLAFLAGGSSPLVRKWVPSPLPVLVSDAVLLWPAAMLALVAVVLFVAVLIGHRRDYHSGSFIGMGLMGATPASLDQPTAALVALAVFDGLFVFHYFVEMFIWKFSDPHFRRTLSGLYFSK